jgi:hypothetical protein
MAPLSRISWDGPLIPTPPRNKLGWPPYPDQLVKTARRVKCTESERRDRAGHSSFQFIRNVPFTSSEMEHLMHEMEEPMHRVETNPVLLSPYPPPAHNFRLDVCVEHLTRYAFPYASFCAWRGKATMPRLSLLAAMLALTIPLASLAGVATSRPGSVAPATTRSIETDAPHVNASDAEKERELRKIIAALQQQVASLKAENAKLRAEAKKTPPLPQGVKSYSDRVKNMSGLVASPEGVGRMSRSQIEQVKLEAAEIDRKLKAYLGEHADLDDKVQAGLWTGDVVIGTPEEPLSIIGTAYVKTEDASSKVVIFQPWHEEPTGYETVYYLSIKGGKVTSITRGAGSGPMRAGGP